MADRCSSTPAGRRANYAAASKALGINLVANPERAADADVGFRVAAWYWTTRGLNSLADKGDFKEITRRINGGWMKAKFLAQKREEGMKGNANALRDVAAKLVEQLGKKQRVVEPTPEEILAVAKEVEAALAAELEQPPVPEALQP